MSMKSRPDLGEFKEAREAQALAAGRREAAFRNNMSPTGISLGLSQAKPKPAEQEVDRFAPEVVTQALVLGEIDFPANRPFWAGLTSGALRRPLI